MKKYLRSLFEEFPHAAAEGYHTFGWRGVYLATCVFLFRYQPFPVSLAGFGKIHSWAEAINFIDNFALGELRAEEVENHLRASTASCVVDVGVNIGVSCRWWLSLADHVQVIGIDMFQEALDFTTGRIDALGARERWNPICGAVGDREGEVEVRFSDPLEGTSRLEGGIGGNVRKIHIQPIDAMLGSIKPNKIGLLKIDIEGSGGRALLGAPKTLAKCDYVSVETHSDDETRTSSQALVAAGFQVFHVRGRTMWWQRLA
jgi:FkbM family methyltransferase